MLSVVVFKSRCVPFIFSALMIPSLLFFEQSFYHFLFVFHALKSSSTEVQLGLTHLLLSLIRKEQSYHDNLLPALRVPLSKRKAALAVLLVKCVLQACGVALRLSTAVRVLRFKNYHARKPKESVPNPGTHKNVFFVSMYQLLVALM